MTLKSVSRMAVLVFATTVTSPAGSQQPPGAPTPAPSVNQPRPNAAAPQLPGDPNVPPAVRPPVLPQRIPAPIQAPGQVKPSPQVTPGQSVPADPNGAVQLPVPAVPAPSVRRGSPGPSFPAGGMVSLNFNRADLVEIIHIIAQQLRLTYTIDPEVKGTVTINSAEPLRSEDLMPIFHQLLRMNGAVAVRTGNLYHITPLKDGKGMARPVAQGREDSFALQLIPVRFFTVAEMKRVLTPFLQPGAEIIDNPRGNFLIVMDTPLNIQRLTEIVDLIDVQVFAGTRMEIYQPKIASAEELSQEMTKVMQSFSASSPQSENFAAQFVPLPRINQLLIIAHSEAAWTYAKRWLDRIDVVAEGPGRRIFIYPVENGKATELADVLNQALGQPSTGVRSSGQTLQSIHRSSSGASNPSGGFGQSSGSGQFGSGGSQQGQMR